MATRVVVVVFRARPSLRREPGNVTVAIWEELSEITYS
jgi:hypothetical protein